MMTEGPSHLLVGAFALSGARPNGVAAPIAIDPDRRGTA